MKMAVVEDQEDMEVVDAVAVDVAVVVAKDALILAMERVVIVEEVPLQVAIAKTVVTSEAVAHLGMVMKARKVNDLDVEDAVVLADITKVVKVRRPSKMEATVVATANVVDRLKIVRMMAESTPEAKLSVKDVVVQEVLAPETMTEESAEEDITTVAARVKMANVALTTTIVVVKVKTVNVALTTTTVVVKAKTDSVVATITAENVAPTIIVVAKAKKVNAEAVVVVVDVVVVAVVAAMVRVVEVVMARLIKTITLAKANELTSHLSRQYSLEMNKLSTEQFVIHQLSSSLLSSSPSKPSIINYAFSLDSGISIQIAR